jgi:hypothetical protein
MSNKRTYSAYQAGDAEHRVVLDPKDTTGQTYVFPLFVLDADKHLLTRTFQAAMKNLVEHSPPSGTKLSDESKSSERVISLDPMVNAERVVVSYSVSIFLSVTGVVSALDLIHIYGTNPEFVSIPTIRNLIRASLTRLQINYIVHSISQPMPPRPAEIGGTLFPPHQFLMPALPMPPPPVSSSMEGQMETIPEAVMGFIGNLLHPSKTMTL